MLYIFIVVLNLEDKSSKIFILDADVVISIPSDSSGKLPIISRRICTFIPNSQLDAQVACSW